jgi:hypothetical protein
MHIVTYLPTTYKDEEFNIDKGSISEEAWPLTFRVYLGYSADSLSEVYLQPKLLYTYIINNCTKGKEFLHGIIG